MRKAKPTEPTRIGDVAPGTIANTPCGTLLVTGQVKNGTMVELWLATEERRVSATFCVSPELEVLSTRRRPGLPVPTAGGVGTEVDPVRG
jgi:hypothetical protein